MDEKGIHFNESDIRPTDLMQQKEPLLERDKDFLRSRINTFITKSCPACLSEKYNYYSSKYGFNFVMCNNCETIYMNPRPTNEITAEFYAHSENYKYWNKYIFPSTVDIRREKIFRPRLNRILDIASKYSVRQKNLLEVGAGYGIFCELAMQSNAFLSVTAVEPSTELAKSCIEKNIPTIPLPIEEYHTEKSFEIVVSFEVIEHLSDPELFLRKCNSLLDVGGLCICTTPNSLSAERFLLGDYSKTFDHEHINAFNTNSIKLLFERTGFTIEEITTPGEIDADIIHNTLVEKSLIIDENSIWNYLFLRDWPKHKLLIQSFLVQAGLSSNMWVVAKKI